MGALQVVTILLRRLFQRRIALVVENSTCRVNDRLRWNTEASPLAFAVFLLPR
jgi:hypothetical protein